MSPFQKAVGTFISLASSADAEPEHLQRAARNVCASIAGTAPKDLDDGLRGLAEVIASAELSGAGVAALCGGAIVENGGDSEIALDATLERLEETLTQAQLFAEACENSDEENDGPDGEDEADPIEDHGESVADWMPENAMAFQAVEPLGMGAIAMLSRSPAGRKRARQQFPDLAALADDLGPYHERAHYLAQMLNVLDDERLVVLHPEQNKGYRVRLTGVSTNFELFVLLADALIGNPDEGWLEGEKPDPAVAAVCRDRPSELAADLSATGAFNFWNWRGLRPDGTLPSPTEATGAWIWMEGIPADIESFERQRVILLGTTPYRRHWKPGRCFESMIANVQVEAKLSQTEVQQWLAKLATA